MTLKNISSPSIIIYRHRRENKKKCTLEPLKSNTECSFFTYPQEPLQATPHTLVLSMQGPPLTKNDRDRPLLIIDGTWRYAEKMQEQTPLIHTLEKRSLPACIKTAYPRKQEDCPDPDSGLASIEALFIARLILELPAKHLLDNYHFKRSFLEKNAQFLKTKKFEIFNNF
ncbi:hypothetical protein COB21_00420 [Candidatus Aerophobetes bacterium]|uniref:tRNA-uridine aminocarboxypropyltransferase n=1 Tax=Aerophobetes bacterium TaxID=2030807 RepID=A0A2A4X7W0_UNCAE|nr:MAG: hypothetical protein COB21_00420 [Candidatus Aerophobetes bacterium]